jgi:hypothetical protein
MRIAGVIVGALLGLVFVASGLVVLLNVAPTPPPPPEGSPAAGFFSAFGPTRLPDLRQSAGSPWRLAGGHSENAPGRFARARADHH